MCVANYRATTEKIYSITQKVSVIGMLTEEIKWNHAKYSVKTKKAEKKGEIKKNKFNK